jgi:glycosyltransferase involved in cell wall biosynthesis
VSGRRADLRVLLFSPMPGVDPSNGDVTYTESLLASPPEGVTYVPYTEAIRSGELRLVGTRRTSRSLIGIRCAIARKTQRAFARARLAFREPVLTAEVRGKFDLVHVHVFNVGFVGSAPPLITSNALPTHVLYEDYEQWTRWRVWIARRVMRALAHLARSRLVSDTPFPDAEFVLFSEYLARYYANSGIDPRRLHVVPNFVRSVASSPSAPRSTPYRLGFVAKSFAAKGGPAVVEAFRILRARMPGAELVCVGHEPPVEFVHEPGIQWVGEVAREKLLDDLVPSFDAFVYPTHFDGFPYVVIEALSVGCPVVTVRYRALPELVPHEVAGLVCPNDAAATLAAAMARVLQPDENARLRAGARRWFEANYSEHAVLPRLGNLYDRTAGVAR